MIEDPHGSRARLGIGSLGIGWGGLAFQTFNGESAGLAPGSYDFHCKIHPTMTGTVIVV